MLLEEAKDQFARIKQAELDTRDIHIHLTKDYEGHITVEYHIGEYGDTDRVKGRDLHDIVTEFLRRKGWTEANKPMKLIGHATVANA